MLVSTVGSFLAVGAVRHHAGLIAGVICLVICWLSVISSLLQYTCCKTQTPENMLGRMNGLWTAQNVSRETLSARGVARRSWRNDDAGRFREREDSGW